MESKKKTTKKQADGQVDKGKVLEGLVKELLELLGVPAKSEILKEDADGKDLYRVNFSGDDLGILIGYHGETLAALQLFLNLALYRECGEWPQVLLDVGGYRAEQEERLKAIAQRVAERALFENRPVEMRPMPAFERRMIHTAIAEIDGVTSESEGEGRERRVVVKPK